MRGTRLQFMRGSPPPFSMTYLRASLA
jgi:hypothetical protein